MSPDAAWARAEQIALFADDDGFWQLMPDVVVEVASRTDSWPRLLGKIDAYVADGVAYALAIDPLSGERYECGSAPSSLTLDIEPIIAA